MANLIEHILRWAGLAEISVPSAAVTDDDTREWSRESYERDLDNDKPRMGEAS